MRLILTRRRRRRRGAARRCGASPWTCPPFPDAERPPEHAGTLLFPYLAVDRCRRSPEALGRRQASLSLSLLNLTRGARVSAPLSYIRIVIRRRIQPECAFSFGLCILAETFSVFAERPLGSFLFITEWSPVLKPEYLLNYKRF